MTNTNKQIEEIAQEIQDHFFAIGAVIKKQDYDWLITILQSYAQARVEEVLERFYKVEKAKWKDAEHCTCLGFAIGHIGGKKWEEKVEALQTPPKE